MEQAVFDIIFKAVAARVVAALPFLGMKFINPIFEYALRKLLSIIYEEATYHLEYLSIQFKAEAVQAEYEKSVSELKQVLAAPVDEAAIKKAQDEFKEKLAKLIHFNKP